MTIRELTNELHYACEIAGHDADEEVRVYVGEWGQRLYPLGSLDSDSKIVALQPALGLDDELRAEHDRPRDAGYLNREGVVMPEGKRSSDNCPTCGQAVSIQTGDDGTSYYVPVAEARHAGASAGQAAYKAEIERLRASVDRVLEHLALGEDVPVDAYEDLRALVENAP